MSTQADLKLYDLNGHLREHTEDLQAIERKMNSFFTHEGDFRPQSKSSSDFWNQIKSKVDHVEGP